MRGPSRDQPAYPASRNIRWEWDSREWERPRCSLRAALVMAQYTVIPEGAISAMPGMSTGQWRSRMCTAALQAMRRGVFLRERGTAPEGIDKQQSISAGHTCNPVCQCGKE